MKLCCLLLVMFFFGTNNSVSQSKFNLLNTESDKIKFELIDNLIIIPVSVNGIELSFLLDSGVSRPILFNILNFADSLQLKKIKTTFLRGLGADGVVSSIKSEQNVVRIGKAINMNQDLYVVFDNAINFTPILGIPVHGIIGYDLFRDFVVEINYARQFIKLHNPQTYTYKRCRKCETLNLKFHNSKPFLNALIETENDSIQVNLLIDTGGSDDLWLFENDSVGILPMNDKYFDDYLGRGLSGSVYGKRSKVKEFKLKSFKFKNVNSAFPDSATVQIAQTFKDRNGSISGGLLRRFNLIMDYPSAKLTLKKNHNFKLPFEYNKSGIVLEQRGLRVVKEVTSPKITDMYGRENESGITITTSVTYGYSLKPAYEVVVVRPNSVAEKAGVKIGDVIISINGKETQNLTLQAVNKMFYLDVGSNIRMTVLRDENKMSFQFKLVDVFQ